MTLAVGKLSNDRLQSLLQGFSNPARSEVLLGPSIGEDCAVLDFGSKLCLTTTDPITGADENVGLLAVHVACNDLASSGAEPVGLMVTLLAPPATEFEKLKQIMDQIRNEADRINACIIGGHTEITDAVSRVVVSITAFGKADRGKVVFTSGGKPGDSLLLTKYAGTEGTAILAQMHEDFLKNRMEHEYVDNGKKLINSISVLKEGLLSARYGVDSMHDVTEGGVLGAVWEMANASGCGAKVHKEKIPVLQETLKICAVLNVDPLKLISSGCMLIACKNGEGLADVLRENGIAASVIGELTEDGNCILVDENKMLKIVQPESDELYKARLADREV